ncbi:MAG: hypothetical protein R3F60_08140 [bacterium]
MPLSWAEGYGYDAFGPFAEIFVGDVCQRFRWPRRAVHDGRQPTRRGVSIGRPNTPSS